MLTSFDRLINYQSKSEASSHVLIFIFKINQHSKLQKSICTTPAFPTAGDSHGPLPISLSLYLPCHIHCSHVFRLGVFLQSLHTSIFNNINLYGEKKKNYYHLDIVNSYTLQECILNEKRNYTSSRSSWPEKWILEECTKEV